MTSPTGTLVEKASKWAESIDRVFADLANQEAQNINSRQRFHIFRVPESWKKLHKDVFDPDFLSLGLFSKLDCTDVMKTPTQFKMVLVKGLIDHVNTDLLDPAVNKVQTLRKDLDWKALCDSVVPHPGAMRAYYDLDEIQRTEHPVVCSVLTLDSVFLCGYLYAYLLKKSFPRSLYTNIVEQKSLSFHQKLMNDIVKLENQIPLDLIRRVEAITCGAIPVIKAKQEAGEIAHENLVSSSDTDSDTNDCSDGFREICSQWVVRHSDSLPGFDRSGKDPDFLRRIRWQDCHHLLGCLCRVMERRPKTTPPGDRMQRSSSITDLADLLKKLFGREDSRRRLRRTTRIHRERAHRKEISLPAASKLRQRGIRFRTMKSDTGNLVPIFERGGFRNLSGVLHIPSFSILQNTELVWRNMLAYILHCNASESELRGKVEVEADSLTPDWLRRRRWIKDLEDEMELLTLERQVREMFPEEKMGARSMKSAAGDFVCFMMFMNEMIDKEKDVALLRDGKNRVIKKSLLGSNKEVAQLFNTIARQQTMASIDYEEDWQRLREEIDDFVSDEGRIAVLEFFRYFFGETWLFPSVAAALSLLSLAAAQTVYTILGYYHRQ